MIDGRWWGCDGKGRGLGKPEHRKAEDWESQSIVKGNGKGCCNAIVGGLINESSRRSEGLKKGNCFLLWLMGARFRL